MMVLPSATAHLNSPVITLAVRACGEESALMNPVPAVLTGLPRFFLTHAFGSQLISSSLTSARQPHFTSSPIFLTLAPLSFIRPS